MDNTVDVKKSKRREYMEEGVLQKVYSGEYFCSVKPAYQIEKVLFDFVKLGTNGQVHVDIYMDIDIFKAWMTDVKNNVFTDVINAERAEGAKYPKVYKYTTGHKGEKTIGFGASSVSFAFLQGSGYCNGKKFNAFIPVTRFWIMTLCDLFFGTSKAFYNALYAKTLENSEKYFTSSGYTEEDISEYSDTSKKQQFPSASGEKDAPAASYHEQSKSVPVTSTTANKVISFVKTNIASRLRNQNDEIFLSVPVRIQTQNGGYSQDETKLIIFARDIRNELFDMLATVKPECLMPFSGHVEQADGLYRLLDFVQDPKLRS